MSKLFKTRRLPKNATAVVHNPFHGDGTPVFRGLGSKKKHESIVTIFGGSDGGKSEAKNLCDMLNFAYNAFQAGDSLSTGDERLYCPRH